MNNLEIVLSNGEVCHHHTKLSMDQIFTHIQDQIALNGWLSLDDNEGQFTYNIAHISRFSVYKIENVD